MKVILYPAVSLDGFIATSDGDSDWVSSEDEKLFYTEAGRCGAVIVGRRTYEQYKGDIYPIKDTVTYVCSTKAQAGSAKVKFVSGTAKEILQKIEADGFSEVLVGGGGEVNGLFVELADEFIVSVYPLALGDGVKLFGSQSPKLNLEFVSSKQLTGGIVQNRYKVKL